MSCLSGVLLLWPDSVVIFNMIANRIARLTCNVLLTFVFGGIYQNLFFSQCKESVGTVFANCLCVSDVSDFF